MQSNLASTYDMLGRFDESLSLKQAVYSGFLKLKGESQRDTLIAAYNYATSLLYLKRFQEGKPMLRKLLPVARRAVGENDELTLSLRANYALALYSDPATTLTDLREAETTLEDVGRIARRVFGGAHPLTVEFGRYLQYAQAVLRARETPSKTS